MSDLPRVDFYVLADAEAGARERFSCRLLEKALDAGHRIYVQVDSAAAARDLDALLWTYSDRSFLPHELLEESRPVSPRTPVLIGDRPPPPEHADLLVNLTQSLPEGLERYQRIAEIVAGDAEGRKLARERFRQYRERGCTLESHNL